MLDVAPILVLQGQSSREDDELPASEHPTDDESLPSYQCEAYRAMLPHLLTMRELYAGQKSWMANGKVTNINVAKKYLPQETKEEAKEYESRLIRSPFENFIEPAISGFAGLMSDITLGDEVSPSIVQHQTNVDLQGNNLETFWLEADALALRDGMVGVLTEYPSQFINPTETYDRQQERLELQKLRPYFCLVERIDIPNWDIEFVDGSLVINQITIRETQCLKVGRFGSKTVTRYRVLQPGRFEVWRIVKGGDGKPASELVEQGEILAKNKAMPVPLTLYSPSTLNPFEAKPPLLDLAMLNIRHFQSASDYYEVMRKCNLPVPVRKGLIVEGQQDFAGLPPVVIGPNSVIDVPQSGDFHFAEPSGSAIAATRTAIIDLEAAILRRTLAFLNNDSAERTATEANLKASQSQSVVLNLAIRKESAMEFCFDFWAKYEGADKGGRPEVHKDILSQALDAQIVATLSGLVSQSQLSLRTFLQLLISGKILPRDTDVESEIAQVQQDKQSNLQVTLEAAAMQQKLMTETETQGESAD